MEGGISNKTIVRCFTNSVNYDVKKNVIGVFPSSFVNRSISFHNMKSESDSHYPFAIMKTD